MLLGRLNRIIRRFGFVLVVESPDSASGKEPTKLYFQSARRWPFREPA